MNYDQVIAEFRKMLVEESGKDKGDTISFYLIPDSDQKEVRGVAVCEIDFPNELKTERLPIHEDMPYEGVIVIVGPEQFKKLESGELSLPREWGENAFAAREKIF